MSNTNFLTYGIFRTDCESIWRHFIEMESLRQDGKQNSQEWKAARDAKDDRQKAVETSLYTLSGNVRWKGVLAGNIINSAKMSLRFPHITETTLNDTRDNYKTAAEVSRFLYKCGIREITVAASYISAVETLSAFFDNGWLVEGAHTLPDRYHDYAGGAQLALHLVRPVLYTPKQDWED